METITRPDVAEEFPMEDTFLSIAQDFIGTCVQNPSDLTPGLKDQIITLLVAFQHYLVVETPGYKDDF